MKKLLLATGQEQINRAVSTFQDYQVVGIVEDKADLKSACYTNLPDIVLVTEALPGKTVMLTESIIEVKKHNPEIRFIYLSGFVDIKHDIDKVNKLGTLVLAGVYDIHHEKKINIELLKDLFSNPKQRNQVDYLLRYLKEEIDDNSFVEVTGFEEEEIVDADEQGYGNVFIVSSIKPGTGKSFVSTNIATAIAKYGKKKDGKAPKVAIIEGDLQNLSVGTLLQIEDNSRNLKTVMQEIATIMDENGNFLPALDAERMAQVDRFIRGCFKPYYDVRNLEALVGSQLKINEVENISPSYYLYLIEVIHKEFDVIIIDSNSSLAHITTYPLLNSANRAYYVLNLDFNNVRNNTRYKTTLDELGILHKVRYILNEDIAPSSDNEEELVFTAEHLNESGFKLEAKIPEIPKTIFYNRLYEGKPIVLDDTDYTLKARLEISKVANQIWEIENLENLEKQYQKYLAIKNGTQKKGFFKK